MRQDSPSPGLRDAREKVENKVVRCVSSAVGAWREGPRDGVPGQCSGERTRRPGREREQLAQIGTQPRELLIRNGCHPPCRLLRLKKKK